MAPSLFQEAKGLILKSVLNIHLSMISPSTKCGLSTPFLHTSHHTQAWPEDFRMNYASLRYPQIHKEVQGHYPHHGGISQEDVLASGGLGDCSKRDSAEKWLEVLILLQR